MSGYGPRTASRSPVFSGSRVNRSRGANRAGRRDPSRLDLRIRDTAATESQSRHRVGGAGTHFDQSDPLRLWRNSPNRSSHPATPHELACAAGRARSSLLKSSESVHFNRNCRCRRVALLRPRIAQQPSSSEFHWDRCPIRPDALVAMLNSRADDELGDAHELLAIGDLLCGQ